MKNKKCLMLSVFFLTLFIVALILPKWVAIAHERELSAILERFQSRTKINFPSTTQILEGKDLSGRDFQIELVLFFPRKTIFDFKKMLDNDGKVFKSIDYQKALRKQSLILSFDYDAENATLWEYGEINYNHNVIIVLLAYQKDKSCIAFVRYLSL